MSNHVVISIGRQFGSGGHEVGKRLASRLGIPFYDKNLVSMAAEQLEISNITAATLDEKALDYFLSTYENTDEKEPDESSLPLSEQMYLTQSKIIKNLAEKGPCVIVGRCTDYLLRDCKNCVAVFIYGNEEDKVSRIADMYGISEKKARDKIKKVDAERKYYYENHTGKVWGSIETHPILFNTSLIGIENVVAVLESVYKIKTNK